MSKNKISDLGVFNEIIFGNIKIKNKILNFHDRINFIQLYTLIYLKYIFFHFQTSIQYISVYLHHNHLSEKNKLMHTTFVCIMTRFI